MLLHVLVVLARSNDAGLLVVVCSSSPGAACSVRLVVVSGLPSASLVASLVVLVVLVIERVSASSVATWQSAASVQMFTAWNIAGSSAQSRAVRGNSGT